jgi:DNA transformation protein and related proteins
VQSHSESTAELARLRNLGTVSAGWLVAAGIRTEAELRTLGAVAAFRRVAMHRSGDVSLNLLYALEGALRDVRWDRLPAAERAALRAAAEAPGA